MYIPDPTELMDMRMERQIDLIDKDGLYPCCKCGKKGDPDEMHSISADPSAPLWCGCKQAKKKGPVLNFMGEKHQLEY